MRSTGLTAVNSSAVLFYGTWGSNLDSHMCFPVNRSSENKTNRLGIGSNPSNDVFELSSIHVKVGNIISASIFA